MCNRIDGATLHRITRRYRCAIAIIAASATAAACRDRPTRLVAPEPDQVARPVTADASEIRPVTSLLRADVEMTATGSFRPNTPITINAKLIGNLAAERVEVRIDVLNGDSFALGAGNADGTRSLARWSGSVSPGERRAVLNRTIQFSRPDYYLIAANVVAIKPRGEVHRADTLTIDDANRSLWVYVDDSGGRLTNGFDASVTMDSTRYLAFGSYGPFLPRPERRPPPRKAERTAQAMAIYQFTGRLVYQSGDAATLNDTLPVVGAQMIANCQFWSDFLNMWVSVSYTGITDANGNSSIECNDEDDGYAQLFTALDNQYANVKGHTGADVAGYVYASSSQPVQFVIGNHRAAKVFMRLTTAASRTQSKFGATRSKLNQTWVSETDDATGYDPSPDRIRYGYATVWDGEQVDIATLTIKTNQRGTASIAHEYGHAFHYWNEEPRGFDSECANSHSMFTSRPYRCAWVEAFADFFATWTLGDLFLDSENSGYASDYRLEVGSLENPYRQLGDGATYEGAIAAFFYDLVDGTNEPDAANNTSNGDEAFDQATYPGSYLMAAMKTCNLNYNPGTLFWYNQVGGVDELVYCLENSLTGRSAVPITNSWRNHVGYSESATEPSGWSASEIRQLWLYNLYNVGP